MSSQLNSGEVQEQACIPKRVEHQSENIQINDQPSLTQVEKSLQSEQLYQNLSFQFQLKLGNFNYNFDLDNDLKDFAEQTLSSKTSLSEIYENVQQLLGSKFQNIKIIEVQGNIKNEKIIFNYDQLESEQLKLSIGELFNGTQIVIRLTAQMI